MGYLFLSFAYFLYGNMCLSLKMYKCSCTCKYYRYITGYYRCPWLDVANMSSPVFICLYPKEFVVSLAALQFFIDILAISTSILRFMVSGMRRKASLMQNLSEYLCFLLVLYLLFLYVKCKSNDVTFLLAILASFSAALSV